MNNICSCNRSSRYDKKYLVKGFIEGFGENEEWWDGMTDCQFDGEVVALELTDDKFITSGLQSQFDLELGDLKELGNVKVGDW